MIISPFRNGMNGEHGKQQKMLEIKLNKLFFVENLSQD
jgi:hypothetical protein